MPHRLFSLTAMDWLRLCLAVSVAFLELCSRVVFYLLPSRLVAYLDIERALVFFPNFRLFKDEPDTVNMARATTTTMTTLELARHYGYTVEQHMAITDDGYVLGLHRLTGKVGGPPTKGRPPVLLMHGLMQSSEVWVCFQDALAFQLVDAGYDVWLGNARGNKYSCRHKLLKPSNSAFWDFSLDEMALHDVPATINHVLEHNRAPTLAYVAFSQGSAVGFACFSLQQRVAARVNLFVALSPAAKARGLQRGFLQSVIHVAPKTLFLVFGTGALLTSVSFWRRIWTRAFYARVIDVCTSQLFAWSMVNMGSVPRREELYAHLFAFASVKTIVHWFQIVASNRFQAYDENQNFSKGYQDISPMEYPINQIACPLALLYGSIDDLTDMPWLLACVPPATVIHSIPDYEHLDTIWATSAPALVFPKVAALIREHVPHLHEKKVD